MKLRSPLPKRRARLEIIPLIDIMFFLLASFMMVSLQMQKMRTIHASLPTATLVSSAAKPDMIKLQVDKYGNASIDGQQIAFPELQKLLSARLKQNPSLPVYISGSRDATHGSMIYVLDFVKRTGVSKVAFAVKPAA